MLINKDYDNTKDKYVKGKSVEYNGMNLERTSTKRIASTCRRMLLN